MIALVLTAAMMAPTEPSANDLDFWLGEWDAPGKMRQGSGDEWTDTQATNTITKVLGDKVIQESFKMGAFEGHSHSVYDAKRKVWQQTWTDSSGGYLLFEGGKQGDKFVLNQTNTAPGVKMRMVFHDIKKDSFVWDWMSSSDDGKTWRIQWTINYKRLK